MTGNTQVIVAVVIFLATYAIMISEKVHRTIIAGFGAALMLILGIETFTEAVDAVDFNAIGLLIGMMIIVGLTRESGIFGFMAVSIVKLGKGKPVFTMIALSVLTAVVSGFIDNVTMILLIVPISVSIARILRISPVPIVFSEIMLSNIGGTATLIGDPPNIMIGGAAGFSFNDFIINLAPVLIVIAVIVLLLLYLMFRKQLAVKDEYRQQIMELDPKGELKDMALAKKSIIVMVITILGFVMHETLHLESATIALSGAALLLIVVRPNPEHALRNVEWGVIFFFLGLFVLVGGIEKAGVLEALARKTIELTGGELLPTGMALLWVGAIASAFIDNIPFTATMIPLVQNIGTLGHFANIAPLWWSLSLGVCLGGNGTIFGASANVVAVGLLEEQGYKISFLKFIKWGFPLMILSIVISSVYLYFFYLT